MRHIQTGPALVCILLLIGSAQLGKCSLAAYSETRSFRDALDGRSMEEAISGPVDKDTSSYGDRTSSGPANSNGATGNQSPMMLAIPANGNLNNMMMSSGQQDQQQQQQTTDMQEQEKSSNGGSELEREAGPINGLPMDTQQQSMEQKAARQTNGQSMSGRLSAPAMMMMMMNSQSSMPKNARQQQQQQQQQEADYGSQQSTGGEPGFGDEQSAGTKQPGMSKPSGKGPSSKQAAYGKSNGSGEPRSKSGSNGARYGNSDEQQQVSSNGAGPVEQQQTEQQEKSYGGSGNSADSQMAAKQKAMAVMLMSMNMNGMRYSRPSSSGMAAGGQSMNGQYGDKKPTSMAQNMIMSLANKAAYQQQQQQQQQQQRSQRQMAPPMMMLMGAMNGRQSQMASNGNGYSQTGGNMMSAMVNGNGMRGGMRRANQRPMEKKMSPAMMNAMLNKMLSAKQQDKEGAGYMKPAAMAMMMKSPVGAEMLANMMMPQMMSGAMAALPAAKRDQYKRMMMDAIMQQQQQQQITSGEADYSAQDQQQQSMAGDPFGGQQMSPKNVGYGMMSKMGSGGKQGGSGSGSGSESGYDNGEQQRQMGQQKKGGMKSGGAGEYEAQQEQQEQQKQSMEGAAGYGNDQQQMMTPAIMGVAALGKSPMGARSAGKMSMAAAAYPPSAGSAMMSPMEQRKQMGAQGYDMTEQQEQRDMAATKPGSANQGGYSSTEAGPAMDMMQMQAPMMGAGKMSSPMNGFRQAYSQQPMDTKSGTKSTSPGEGSYGSMSAARPMQSYGQAMDSQQEQEPQQQQQQQDEYGSAPMGQAEPFAFDYKIEDDYGNGQYRKEESDKNGVVRGSYGYTDVSGIYRHVEYVADENGFRANIKSNEPGLSSETTKSANSPSPTMQTMEAANQSGMSDSPAGSGGDTQQQQMQYSGQSQIMGENKKKA